jgi:hypothetical protein
VTILENEILLYPKLSDFILNVNVAAGFSLRFSSPNGYTEILRKLRNLKVAAT